MRFRYLRLLIIALLAGIAGSGGMLAAKQPNVIIVITDDQGYGDLSFNGNPHIRTPNLDAFAREGIRFTNYHVSTTCAPTRGALMTGRHSNRVNTFHTISGRSILWEDEVLLPQVLGVNGYRCGMFGKWHLGDNYPYRPEDRGFHEVVRHGGGGVGQMPDFWGNDYFDDTYWHNGQPEQYKGYCTDIFFDQALQFIEANRDRPFFVYLSTNAPHGPLNVPVEYRELYEEVQELPEAQKRFYGMITNIDDNFRRLEAQLDRLGLTENTLLVFMTDNGTAYGSRVFNAGMRGHKGSEYEGGHRVPLILQWPDGGLSGGRDVDNLVAHYDLLPTLVDLLDLQFNPVKSLDGMSIKPLLYGGEEAWPDRILYMDTQRRQNLVKYRMYSVMEGNWRLVNGGELYDVVNDPGQSRNVIAEHPEVAARLAQGYERWWDSFLAEGVNERYAYIKAGSSWENPVRLSSHDMLTAKLGWAWHQKGAVTAVPGSGVWKVEVVEEGDYRISLRRFPRESGLGINASFPQAPLRPEIEQPMPAMVDPGFREAFLYIADFTGTKEFDPDAEEIGFEMHLSRGRYDMEAQLLDATGKTYPAYYVYIERK